MSRLIWAALVLVLAGLFGFQPSAWTAALLLTVVLTPPVSLILLLPLRKRTSVTIRTPSVWEKGKPFFLYLAITSRGAYPLLGSAVAAVSVYNPVTGQRVQRRLPFDQVELKSDYCGCLRLRTEAVYLYDCFGVLRLRIPCRAEAKTLILPNTFPVALETGKSAAPLGECSEYDPDRRGSDPSETFQVREYVPGDPLNCMHWKLTSKLGRLMVRDASLPVDDTLTVFLNRAWEEIPPEQADAMLEATISVCQALCESGIPFRMVWNGDAIHTEPVPDEQHLPEITGLLLNAEGGPVTDLTNTDGAVICLSLTEPDPRLGWNWLREEGTP